MDFEMQKIIDEIIKTESAFTEVSRSISLHVINTYDGSDLDKKITDLSFNLLQALAFRCRQASMKLIDYCNQFKNNSVKKTK